MSRKPRSWRSGVVYHLISRFIDRDWLVTEDRDREYYLKLCRRALATTDWRSLGYAIMSNHIHHGVVAGAQPPDRWIRQIHSPFADWLNKKHQRIGAVFVRGPKQLEVKAGGAARLLAYIHNNPVRAGVVTEAANSSWTSHGAYLGSRRVPDWLHVDEGLSRAGFRDPAEFDAFVSSARATTTQRSNDAGDADDDDFCAEFHVNPRPPKITAAEIVDATAQALQIDRVSISSRRRSPPHVFARHVAAHCADQLGVPGSTIAAAIGVTQQAVSLTLKTGENEVVVMAASIAASIRAKRASNL